MVRKAILILAVLAAAAPATHASTVSIEMAGTTDVQLHYVAAPGEANVLRLEKLPGKKVSVVDSGATITPGAGCTAVDAHTVTCDRDPSYFGTQVELADLDDKISYGPDVGQMLVDGGDGADDLDGTDEYGDTFRGGPGADRMIGHGNSDTFIDSDTDPDVMDGGPGADEVSFKGRTSAVELEDGKTAEGDTISSSDFITLTPFDDKLVTGGGGEFIRALAGDDEIESGGGNDFVVGGAGRDTLDAGPGNDDIDPGGGVDDIHCGDGRDSVRDPVAAEYIHGCEILYFSNLDEDESQLDVDLRAKLISAATVRFPFGCEESELDEGEPVACENTMTLRDAKGRLLAKGIMRGSTDRDVLYTDLTLTPLGAKLASGKQGVRTTGKIRLPDATVSWTYTFRL
jgi:hypothetical protein